MISDIHLLIIFLINFLIILSAATPKTYIYPMWPIQQYTKFALATAYFPGSNYEAATRRLCRWILNNNDLYSHLKETGYNKMQHHFTARQTALIFEYLGEP